MEKRNKAILETIPLICQRLGWVLAFVCSGFFGRLIAHELTSTSASGFVFNEKGRFTFFTEVGQVPAYKATIQKRYYGGDGAVPSLVCSKFIVKIDGTPISIPQKAFADLGDIQTVGVPFDHEKGTWCITIVGGIAGGGYHAELIFNSTKLLERRFIDIWSKREQKILSIEKY